MRINEIQIKKYRWLLLPACLVFGIGLLYTFVTLSQSYLSEYMVENSKGLLGEKLDLGNIAKHLKDARLKDFAESPGTNPVVLVFWSSSCVPCLQDLPKLTEEHPGGLIVPVNTDNVDDLASAETSQKLLAPEFPFLHDTERFLEKSLKIKYLPTSITLDPEGVITKITTGSK